MGISNANNRFEAVGAIHPTTARGRSRLLWRHQCYQLALIIALMTSCTGAPSKENLTELAIGNFQSNLMRNNSPNTPDKDEMGDIMRRNEVFGQLTGSPPEFVESKICEGFTISDLLTTSPTGRRKDDELWQDLTTLASADYPDVFYTITLSALADVDTSQVENNATRLADIFFLAPDKRCTGRVGVGIDDGGGFPRTTNFTTGYFPDDFEETAGVKIFNYVQEGDGTGPFARTVSLMILEPAKSAIAVVVTAYNLRSSNSSVTKDDMLLETSQIGYEIKKRWITKIESDPDWVTILG
jgi:hypothetical protein